MKNLQHPSPANLTRFGLRREAKRHVAFVRADIARSFGNFSYAQKRCRRCALPPQSISQARAEFRVWNFSGCWSLVFGGFSI